MPINKEQKARLKSVVEWVEGQGIDHTTKKTGGQSFGRRMFWAKITAYDAVSKLYAWEEVLSQTDGTFATNENGKSGTIGEGGEDGATTPNGEALTVPAFVHMVQTYDENAASHYYIIPAESKAVLVLVDAAATGAGKFTGFIMAGSCTANATDALDMPEGMVEGSSCLILNLAEDAGSEPFEGVVVGKYFSGVIIGSTESGEPIVAIDGTDNDDETWLLYDDATFVGDVHTLTVVNSHDGRDDFSIDAQVSFEWNGIDVQDDGNAGATEVRGINIINEHGANGRKDFTITDSGLMADIEWAGIDINGSSGWRGIDFNETSGGQGLYVHWETDPLSDGTTLGVSGSISVSNLYSVFEGDYWLNLELKPAGVIKWYHQTPNANDDNPIYYDPTLSASITGNTLKIIWKDGKFDSRGHSLGTDTAEDTTNKTEVELPTGHTYTGDTWINVNNTTDVITHIGPGTAGEDTAGPFITGGSYNDTTKKLTLTKKAVTLDAKHHVVGTGTETTSEIDLTMAAGGLPAGGSQYQVLQRGAAGNAIWDSVMCE